MYLVIPFKTVHYKSKILFLISISDIFEEPPFPQATCLHHCLFPCVLFARAMKLIVCQFPHILTLVSELARFRL